MITPAPGAGTLTLGDESPDRPSEKRKVDRSLLSLTTRAGYVFGALTGEDIVRGPVWLE